MQQTSSYVSAANLTDITKLVLKKVYYYRMLQLQASDLSLTARLERIASAPSVCFVGQYWQYDYQLLLHYIILHQLSLQSLAYSKQTSHQSQGGSTA